MLCPSVIELSDELAIVEKAYIQAARKEWEKVKNKIN